MNTLQKWGALFLLGALVSLVVLVAIFAWGIVVSLWEAGDWYLIPIVPLVICVVGFGIIVMLDNV